MSFLLWLISLISHVVQSSCDSGFYINEWGEKPEHDRSFPMWSWLWVSSLTRLTMLIIWVCHGILHIHPLSHLPPAQPRCHQWSSFIPVFIVAASKGYWYFRQWWPPRDMETTLKQKGSVKRIMQSNSIQILELTSGSVGDCNEDPSAFVFPTLQNVLKLFSPSLWVSTLKHSFNVGPISMM